MSEQWAYRFGRGSAEGPFETKEAAIADAKENYSGEKISFGRVIEIKPEQLVFDSIYTVDNILEQMQEGLEIDYDEWLFFTDDEGKKELEKLLKDWAAKYVTAEIDWYMEDEEEIVV